MSNPTVDNFKAFYEQIRPYLGAVHSGFTPIGTVISVMGTTAPLNYLACDGTIYNIADYPELAAYFNQQFGASNHFGGDGTTTFAVPDLRGEFLRGTGTNSHANQGSGAAVGVHQDGTEIPFIQVNDSSYIQCGITPSDGENFDFYKNSTGRMYFSGSADSAAIMKEYYTSRPTNTSVLYCIASKNIFMDAGSNYSTEEQVVGTWIDGKPLYQKTWTGLNIQVTRGGDSWLDIVTVQDIETAINATFYWLNGIGRFAEVTPSEYGVVKDNTLSAWGFFETRTLVAVTVQYTKTTDA